MDTEGIWRENKKSSLHRKSSFDAVTSFVIIYLQSVTSECLMIPLNKSMLLHSQTTTYNVAKQIFFFFFLFDNKVCSTGSRCVKQMVKG